MGVNICPASIADMNSAGVVIQIGFMGTNAGNFGAKLRASLSIRFE